MAYIGRGWLSIVYFILTILICPLAGILFVGESRPIVYAAICGVLILFFLTGLAHTFILARRIPAGMQYKWYSRWYAVIPIFLLVPFSLAFGIRSFIVQPFTIPSGANIPTIVVGDYLLASKMAYGYSEFSIPFMRGLASFSLLRIPPARGDMVIFGRPSDPSINHIMRVIGMPGDRVQMKDGILYLNDVAVKREPAGTHSNTGNDNGDSYSKVPVFRETLPGGRTYLTLDLSDDAEGDNTQIFTVPPGYYFVLGDNRDNSNDSRFSMGFVPEHYIYAKALSVYDGTKPGFPFRTIQ